MKTIQENKISMYLTVNDYLGTNATIITGLPNIAGFLTSFRSEIGLIQGFAEQQVFDKKGFALNKAQLKSTVIMYSMDTSRRLIAYAKFNNNLVLLNEANYLESDLKRSADSALRDIAQGLYDRAQTNLTALSVYGITTATQTLFQSAINSFTASIPKTRIGIMEKRNNTKQLETHLLTADGALKNIDILVELVKITQPIFYNGYISARKIINHGSTSLALICNVKDAISGEPIKRAKLVIENQNKLGKMKPIIKKTANKGGLRIKSLQEGTYNVIISHVGYSEQKVFINVSDGELARLNIELEKVKS